jgi:hypothetical protein
MRINSEKDLTMSLYIDFVTSNSLNTDEQAINNAIRNILCTQLGTLPGKPTFGSRLHELVFAQMDSLTINMMKTVIKEALDYWEKRITIVNIDVEPEEAYNRMIATITYSYRDEGQFTTTQVSLGIQY